MPAFEVRTPSHVYQNVVERGVSKRIKDYLPQGSGKLFLLTTKDVWNLHGAGIQTQFAQDELHVLFFQGGEVNKRLSDVESLAEQMSDAGADRTSLLIGFGGGIVTDIGGFLAAIYMRGIPVVQIPTTLLAQVDAATGGKTGVNLRVGKNLIGSFHQPLAVLIDPDLLSTLPEREYRAGLFEVLKCGVIRDPALFDLFANRRDEILSKTNDLIDQLVAAAVRVKTEVVSEDEKEGDLRKILNFGHTIGHAIEAETDYVKLLHGEAVAWGMLAATELASLTGMLDRAVARDIQGVICNFGPLPPITDLDPDRLLSRLVRDKKTMGGKIHFVLPTAMGEVKVVSGIQTALIREAIVNTLQ